MDARGWRCAHGVRRAEQSAMMNMIHARVHFGRMAALLPTRRDEAVASSALACAPTHSWLVYDAFIDSLIPCAAGCRLTRIGLRRLPFS